MRRASANKRLVLAVSGGRDSMALLHACARATRDSIAVVATFDHGTGEAATAAARLVERDAKQLGLPFRGDRADTPGLNEAEWRESRRRFLRAVAAEVGGAIATAHTRDDQLETILIRVLRDSGARGLAGLYADSEVVRPFLEFSRAEVADYATWVGAAWLEDPSNASSRHLRNRVRRDLLPALAASRPRLADELLELSRRAADWRRALDAATASWASTRSPGGSLTVATADLAPYTRNELAVVWPALAARVGLVMDWRGTERAAAFTNSSKVGRRIQLSGGWELARSRGHFELRRWREGNTGKGTRDRGNRMGTG
ncbi:MAG TPA: tRNA lysidine(34) synthetase TilS [Gemmatimonadaceae bacterium]|nr:tRNA lysidine(34) synthetase TilS [Gemmatimonadaceae bacterium]